ncbi:MAG: class II fumarate hydratase, partial [Actinomycetota bacterium]
MSSHRTEHDSLGEVQVPASAYYGAQTARAAENFQISTWRLSRTFIAALGLVKWAAVSANLKLGLLDERLAAAIGEACEEVIAGKLEDEFILDVFQTGSGTSTNMNANEVIANRANEMLGAPLGSNSPVHPNDHVNLCQSSNDVMPTAVHLGALIAMSGNLMPGLESLRRSLAAKSEQFDHIVKTGRTHLMDAVPVRLGQEFGGWAAAIEHAMARIAGSFPHLHELALGGTAAGTGINAHPDFARHTISLLSQRTGLPLAEAPDHFEAQGGREAAVEASAAVKTAAVSVARVANDLRWLASGPAAGIAEIKLPALQPGSSIMPGKVNPVMPEAVIQVAAQIAGNDAAITMAGMGGAFELNTMMPLMAYDLLFSIETLGAAAALLAEKCV